MALRLRVQDVRYGVEELQVVAEACSFCEDCSGTLGSPIKS